MTNIKRDRALKSICFEKTYRGTVLLKNERDEINEL